MHRQLSLVMALLLAAAWAPSPTAAQARTGSLAFAHAPRFLAYADARGPVPIDPVRTPLLQRRVSLELEGVTLKHALAVISREAGLDLVYSDAILPTARRVRLRAQRITVASALSRVLTDTGVDVVVTSDGRATLVKKPVAEPAPAVAGSIAGRVASVDSGEGLAGVDVAILGTAHAAVTDASGRYRIAGVAPGSYTVVVRGLGYGEARERVTVADGEETEVNFLLETAALPLDELVVTGSITETRTKELPSPITVITAQDIEAKGAPRLDDLLRGEVPSLIVFQDDSHAGGRDKPIMMRGAANQTGSQSSVKVYIDGVEVTNPAYISSLDPSMIERIEVIRGPQASSLYGSEAMNGVIQIFTKKGSVTGLNRPRINGSASLGFVRTESRFEAYQLDEPTLVHDYSMGLTGGAEGYTYNATASYAKEGDWYFQQSSNTRQAQGGFRVNQGPFAAEASIRYLRSQFDLPRQTHAGVLADLPEDPNVAFDQAQATYSLRLSYQPFANWSHELVLGEDRQNYEWWYKEPWGPEEYGYQEPFSYIAVNNWTKGNIRYHTAFNVDVSDNVAADVVGGIETTKTTLNSADAYPADGTGRNASVPASYLTNTRATNNGLFVQGKLGLFDQVFITGAVRQERNSTIGGGAFTTPRAGLVYSRGFDTGAGFIDVKARTSYGRSIKAPTETHRFGSVGTRAVVLPNPDIEPEQQEGWDAGVELYFGSRASFAVTYYDQTVTDLIDNVPVDLTVQPRQRQFQNAGSLDNSGWELEGSLKLGRLSLIGNYAITNSIVRELSPTYTGSLQSGQQVWGVPERQGALSAAYDVFRGRVALDWQHTGAWTEINTLAYYGCFYGFEECRDEYMDYFGPYDAINKIGLRVEQAVNESLSATIRVDNLTNNQLTGLTNAHINKGMQTTFGLRFNY